MAHAPPSDELFHMGRRARTLVVDKDNRMPSVGQILLYVLRLMASDRQWCLGGILDHTVGQARSASVKPISNIALSCLKYSTFSCAVVRLQRMAYCWETF